MGDFPTTDEAMAFVLFGIQCRACEYIVGDERGWQQRSTSLVKDLFLYDFKTSTSLDKGTLKLATINLCLPVRATDWDRK